MKEKKHELGQMKQRTKTEKRTIPSPWVVGVSEVMNEGRKHALRSSFVFLHSFILHSIISLEWSEWFMWFLSFFPFNYNGSVN